MSMCSPKMAWLRTRMGNSSISKYVVFMLIASIYHLKLLNVSQQDIAKFMGEDKLQKLINFALNEMSQITLPCKR